MKLYDTIISLGFVDSDFEVWDDLDGNGEYIKVWNAAAPQPTQQELDDAWAALQAAEASLALDKSKISAKRLIDKAAGRARLRYITDAPGQEMTYQEKAEEAADFVAANYPTDLTDYPFIQAEVDATGKTSTQVANDILAQRATWIAIGAQIEKERIKGKISVDGQLGPIGVETARDNAIATLDAI